jgi:cysteine desulfurase/selenocysteine lyase
MVRRTRRGKDQAYLLNLLTAVYRKARPMPADWQEIRKLFPVAEHVTYLKNCAAAPVSMPVAEAMERYARNYAEIGKYKDPDLVEHLRAKIALLINAQPHEIAFVQNTVTGINIVAQGIRWQQGDEVIVPAVEFPANYYPWYNLRSRGVAVRTVPERSDGTIAVEDILSAIGPRTKLIAISSVQFTNGFRSDLRALAARAHEHGVWLSVDAVQEVGCIPMDVAETGVDFLQSASHKWLLGPIGTGFMFVRHELIDELDVSFVGHDSMVERKEYLPYAWEPWPDARRFEAGVHNHGGLAGLNAAIDLLTDIGIADIAERVRSLTDYLVTCLRDANCQILSPLHDSARSGIILFAHPSIGSVELVARLEAAGVLTSERSGGVRVGPAFYNDERDIDRLMAAIS